MTTIAASQRGCVGLGLDGITAVQGKPLHRVAFFLGESGRPRTHVTYSFEQIVQRPQIAKEHNGSGEDLPEDIAAELNRIEAELAELARDQGHCN